MDKHIQTWQSIGGISLLTWGLFWASTCSLEAWGSSLTSLLLGPDKISANCFEHFPTSRQKQSFHSGHVECSTNQHFALIDECLFQRCIHNQVKMLPLRSVTHSCSVDVVLRWKLKFNEERKKFRTPFIYVLEEYENRLQQWFNLVNITWYFSSMINASFSFPFYYPQLLYIISWT